MRIFAFAGLARAGKTTAAHHLAHWCAEKRMTPILASFAGPMKKAAARVGLDKERNPTQYRNTLQRWGENKRNPEYQPGRSGPDYWVRKAERMIQREAEYERQNYEECCKHGLEDEFRERVIIFDDLRYINELNTITKLGGTSVFVDGVDRISDLSAKWRQHDSEALATLVTAGVIESEVFDYFVPNDKTELDLQNRIDRLAPAWFDHLFLCPCCGLEDHEENGHE